MTAPTNAPGRRARPARSVWIWGAVGFASLCIVCGGGTTVLWVGYHFVEDTLLGALVAENEAHAIETLARVRSAQYEAQKETRVDKDDDGVGEFLTLEELVAQDVLDEAVVLPDEGGYRFSVVVGAAGRSAEEAWHALAVPVEHGRTGTRVFYVDETGYVRGADTGGATPTRSEAELFSPLGS